MNGYGLGIIVDISGVKINDKLPPKVNAAIKNSIQGSLRIIQDRWHQEVQQKLKSSISLYSQGLGYDSIIHPLDSSGLSGAIQLKCQFPNILKLDFGNFSKAQKFKSGNSTSPFQNTTGDVKSAFGSSRDRYGVATKLPTIGGRLSFPEIGNKSWINSTPKRDKKRKGLNRIVRGYHFTQQSQYYPFKRGDNVDFTNEQQSVVKIAVNLTPFAQSTFVDMLTNNLNGIV